MLRSGTCISCRLYFGLAVIFFLSMLIIPTTYQIERGVVLGALAGIAVIDAARGRWLLHSSILFWGLLTVTASILFIGWGVMNDTPGALRVGTVYVLWPALFVFFMGLLRIDQLLVLIKAVIIGSIAVALMALIMVADAGLGLGFRVSTLLENQGAAVGIYDGKIEYRLFNMTTAIYALPFLLGALFVPTDRSAMRGGWRVVAIVALILTVATLLISGRKAFWVVAALAPVVVWGVLTSGGMRANVLVLVLKGGVVGVAIAGISLPLFGLDMGAIWEDFREGFNFSDPRNVSAHPRHEQFFALLHGWMESPIIGAGHGATAISSLRSDEQPWAYELSYMALLFQTGVLGIAIYGAAVSWIFVRGVTLMRRLPDSAGLLVPTLSGLACFLVANATNPYLLKFDYLWTLFLPVAIINAYMLKVSRD